MEEYETVPGGTINRGADKDRMEEAVQDFLAGGQEGFDYIFRQYYPPLCYLAFSLLGSRPAAEDIVSESFLKLWQRRDQLGTRGSLYAWLYTAVHRACIDALRREKRKGCTWPTAKGRWKGRTAPCCTASSRPKPSARCTAP